MIVPNLKGGLGNQMFQIAAAANCAEQYDTKFAINYSLPHYGGQGHSPLKYKDNFYKNISSTNLVPTNLYHEQSFKYTPIKLYNYGDYLIDGYFQSDEYVGVADVRNIFAFPQYCSDKWNKIISKYPNTKFIGIHIRGGDYKAYKNIHDIVDKKYFQRGLEYINKPDHKIIIVTDDWKEVYRDYSDFEFISTQGCNELEDMYILSQCDNLILSNSSFSWWADRLGKSICTVVPDRWFGACGPQNYEDVYRMGWIRL